ncbi:MAG: threonine--tRNA ligase, partial [Deltaproteobacteria bacterium]|nr:threonine--tRNA ligase [Deltaproteobacteria bacterium]
MAEGVHSPDLDALRHSASHLLAQAVTRLRPEAKLAIGPNIETGFYYDFEIPEFFSQEDLKALTEEMKNIVKAKLKIERFELPRDEALELMKDQPYKLELIRALPEGVPISFYRQGEFVDLCAGPHVDNTGQIKAFALLSTAGAYWRGDSANAMLCRVYGTAFENRQLLDAYIKQLEEAKKRDHNKLGRELEYFTTSQVIGQGLPILMPNGAKVIQILERFVEDEEEKRGYLLTKTPYMAKSDLYKISGHWQHYREGMFVIGEPTPDGDDSELLALRPMTCPFQFQVYLAKARSYRDLPLRYNETSTLFRNEASGEMHGLIRVRQFTISEGHLAVRPDQLEDEFKGCLELAIFMAKAVGLYDDVYYRFSKWDENKRDKYIGDKEQWERVQNAMRSILDHIGIDYVEAEGEAAFYGPKLDMQIKNVFGKEDTLVTIQIDFQLAQQFNMQYTDFDGKKKFPYVIHRTSIGCYERTLALLIEKFAGALPLWLSPEQVRVMPITDRANDYGQIVLSALKEAGLRATLDDRNEKINYKIREAQVQKIPYMLVVGDNE